ALRERGRRGEKYILSGEYVSVGDLMSLLEELTGVRTPRLCLPLWLAKTVAAGAPLYMRLFKRQPPFTADSLLTLASNAQISHTRAGRELGYAPRPLPETVLDTLRWFRAVGMLQLPRSARKTARLAEG
ncbi:MAG: epimerase, partial [Chloroflexia bacterium]|nr:epimerase [Chloroflexia bacterium]